MRLPHKRFILLCALIILVPFAVRGIKSYVLSHNYQKTLIIVEGENPKDSNFNPVVVRTPKNRNYFGGEALELDTADPVVGGYFCRYEFDVPTEGDYQLFVAGTPPGPAAEGSEWYSPYSISIDDGDPKPLTEEGLRAAWPYAFKFEYVRGGYYFTKAATAHLGKGRHTVTVTVSQRRRYDDHFTFYLDALIFAPKNFKPQTHVGKIPKDIFYE